MLRSAKRLYPLVSFTIFNRTFENDVDYLNKPPPDAPKTGWARVKQMYTINEQDGMSIELQNVGQSIMSGSFIGACIGGIVSSRSAYLYFIENNQASIFNSTMHAKKKLQDYVTIAFAKGAVRWGWRLGMFTAIFSLSATTMSTYRGDSSIAEYTTAGAIAGGLYKINLGLVAMAVGAGLGAVLGTVFGSLIILLLNVTGASMEDVRKALLTFKDGRKEQMHQVYEKSATIKNDELTRHHDMLVKEKGVQKVENI